MNSIRPLDFIAATIPMNLYPQPINERHIRSLTNERLKRTIIFCSERKSMYDKVNKSIPQQFVSIQIFKPNYVCEKPAILLYSNESFSTANTLLSEERLRSGKVPYPYWYIMPEIHNNWFDFKTKCLCWKNQKTKTLEKLHVVTLEELYEYFENIIAIEVDQNFDVPNETKNWMMDRTNIMKLNLFLNHDESVLKLDGQDERRRSDPTDQKFHKVENSGNFNDWKLRHNRRFSAYGFRTIKFARKPTWKKRLGSRFM